MKTRNWGAKECVEAGITNIWIHKGIGHGSRSDQATEYMKDKPEVNFIDGACPMMFVNEADFFTKALKTCYDGLANYRLSLLK